MGSLKRILPSKLCLDAIKEVKAEMQSLGLKVKLGPEVMGRKFQVGSLDEILAINEQVEGTQLVIDWGHLHARGLGALKNVEDFRAVAEKVEQKLGTEALREYALPFFSHRV